MEGRYLIQIGKEDNGDTRADLFPNSKPEDVIKRKKERKKDTKMGFF